MLGLLLIYWIGNLFYKLADKFGKSKWGFAILGVVVYYAGTILGAMAMAIAYELFLDGNLESVNEMVLSILSIPVGLLVCWGFYKLLESQWKKPANLGDATVLDTSLMDEKPSGPSEQNLFY